MVFDRRGVSPLIANLLIILIVIVMVSAIALALVPVIKKSLSGFGNCLDAQNSLDIVQTRLTCYDTDDNLGGMTVKVNKEGLKKFRIAFTDNLGLVTLFDVIEGDNPSGFGMFGQGMPMGAGSQQIRFPDVLQQLNYIASSSGNDFVKLEISPVVKKDVCPVDDIIDLNYCAPDVNLGQEPVINVNINICGQGASCP